MPVLKIMAAAAEAGLDLEGTLRVGQRANERTRTLGIAFTGCTLPGASEPLFSLQEGTMALGLGIHGEPGIEEGSIASADEIAGILVERLVADAPVAGAARVAVVLNGLGSIKYEEMFVVYRKVFDLLQQRGLEAVDPDVGEFVTSFDMAGISLTLTWLDTELEGYWGAAVDTPAYRKGEVSRRAAAAPRVVSASTDAGFSRGSDASRSYATHVVSALEHMLSTLEQRESELGDLDAVAGDGDHGIGMTRGARAAVDAARRAAAEQAGAGTVLIRAGEGWADRGGGTSGALWGAALTSLGESVGDDEAPTPVELASGIRWGLGKIQRMGGAALGDKTMLDAAMPFVESLTVELDTNSPFDAAWTAAALEATLGAETTSTLSAKLGRARTHGDKSLGTRDPGATSFAYIVTALGEKFSIIAQKKESLS
mgnify:FL=1